MLFSYSEEEIKRMEDFFVSQVRTGIVRATGSTLPSI